MTPHHHGPESRSSVIIDCDRCLVRGPACTDCVVTMLLGGPPQGEQIEEDELVALAALSGGGLVPPLRLVTGVDGRVPDSA